MSNCNSVIFFHNNNSQILYDVTTISQKLNLNMFECSTLSNLFETIKLLAPAFIIIENKSLEQSKILKLAEANKNIFIFVLGEFCTSLSNTICCKDLIDLESKLLNLCMRLDKNVNMAKDVSKCYNFVTTELESLNFSIKHIGSHYVKEIIIQLYKSSSSLHCPLKDIYPYLSIKFNCNANTIERAIRFAISKAYCKCKEKDECHYIFGTHPTVKQLTSYILDKFLSSIA